ncbi:hypothetical protein ACMU_12800 [Actibacterium mucosum KCTC 23349]|uniref:ATP synthase subunit E n=1 Tax=Actibacterium mucosum KCTC 23349 TaxID=1454373 RepID=A0A037ZL58_9RHOB|nr:hypothetical protein [Actibacterium mucosum]KAJ55566.1 hypothetical protein ACMU_12800 [Actibacterium mucosum KCTC 23349]
MTQNDNGQNCALKMWAIAGVAGLVILVVMLIGDRSFMASLFTGVIAAGLLGVILTWLFCRPEERARAATANVEEPAAPTPEPASESVPAPAAAPEPTSDPEPAPVPEAAPEKAAAAPETAPQKPHETVGASDIVTPSKPLAGEAELADRKGSWTYGNDTAPDSEPEDTTAERRPAALDGAREGGADDLKKIKGVGPKLEALLNTMGFYHFDQIAAWTDAEVAWVDENLQGFKGRVSRDAWVSQAQTLASGGATAFSKKVDEGDVYE